MARYPLMQPQDYGKLAYQSEFGPEHMITGTEQVLPGLLEEWGAVCGGCPQSPELIGNGLARFHLTNTYTLDEAAPLLAELFTRTAQSHSGTQWGLLERLESFHDLNVNGMKEWLGEYQERGCPPVHHSEVFRTAYQPRYRVLRAEFANFFPALLAIRNLTRSGKPVVASIDGRCGSGKSSLTALIAELFSCNVFHMDDYYLPVEQRASNWTETPAGNMDISRFLREVLMPTKYGSGVRYRPYDCRMGSYRELALVSAKPLTIVEGSYSQHPMLSAQYDLTLFLTCSREAQARRLKAREGAYFKAFQTRWIPMEELYFQAFGIERCSMLTLDTSNFFRHEYQKPPL
jgi:uridine kinase